MNSNVNANMNANKASGSRHELIDTNANVNVIGKQGTLTLHHKSGERNTRRIRIRMPHPTALESYLSAQSHLKY